MRLRIILTPTYHFLLNKFKNINNLETEINGDLETLNGWADKWNMDFNPAKTKVVIFSNIKVKSKPNIHLKGEQIEQVSSYKHLGVFLSQDMKWTTHIDHSVKKVRKKFAQLFEYNLTKNPFCAAVETPLHFFTECTSYDPYRQIFFRNLLILNSNLSTQTDFLNYMHTGSNIENRGQRIRENETIFRNLSVFMYKTQRFFYIDARKYLDMLFF